MIWKRKREFTWNLAAVKRLEDCFCLILVHRKGSVIPVVAVHASDDGIRACHGCDFR